MTEPFEAAKAAPILRDAVCAVMADMAFIDTEALPPGLKAARNAAAQDPAAAGKGAAAMSRAAIDALKPASCCIELRMTEALRARITDILYAGDGPEDASQDEAVLEILNVIAGNFLTGYFGAGTEIKLSLPRFMYAGETPEGSAVVELAFDSEGEPLEAVLSSVRYRY
jgi:hypothetical protein